MLPTSIVFMVSKYTVVRNMVAAFQTNETVEGNRSLWKRYEMRWGLDTLQPRGSMFNRIANKGEWLCDFQLWEDRFHLADVKDGETVTIIGPLMGLELFQAAELLKDNKIIVIEPDKVAYETLSELSKYYTTSDGRAVSDFSEFYRVGMLTPGIEEDYKKNMNNKVLDSVSKYDISESKDTKEVLGTEFTDVVVESRVYGAMGLFSQKQGFNTLGYFIGELASYLRDGGRFVCHETLKEMNQGIKGISIENALFIIGLKKQVDIKFEKIEKDNGNRRYEGYVIIGEK
jgi:hypothetical protein